MLIADFLTYQAFLAYHLFTYGKQNLLPTTWSPAYQDITDLIEIMLPFELLLILSPSFDISLAPRTISDLHLILKKMSEIEHQSLKRSDFLQSSWKCIDRLIKNEIDIVGVKTAINEELRRFLPTLITSNIWILKPIGLSCGEQIQVVNGLVNCLATLESYDNMKCIVQKYVERPLLVRKCRKFDIRQWILITSLEPVKVFGFSECYLRLSSRAYSLDINQLTDNFIHLTNHAIQKSAESIDCSESFACDTMMSQREFIEELLSKYGEDLFTSKVLPQLKNLAIDAVESVADRLVRVGGGFEWLGLDFIVDEDLNVSLLEVNTSPDISHSTSITATLVDCAVHDLFNILLSSEDNSPVASDLPHWEEWHCKHQSGLLQQSRKKHQVSKLHSDCKPKQVQFYRELLQEVLKQKLLTSNESEDDDSEF